MKSSVQIWIFHALSIKIFLGKFQLISPDGVGLLNLSSLQFWTFNAISNKLFLLVLCKAKRPL